jgi:hypothetical protein
MATYMTRLSAVLTQGEQINPVLVLEPTTTAWMYQGDGGKLNQLGDGFSKLLLALEAAQVEYDLGCEDVLVKHASVSGKGFRVGRRDYSIVVLPPFTENLNAHTVRLLERFLQAGGTVLSCVEPPSRVNGGASPQVAALATHRGWKRVEPGDLPPMLLPKDVAIRRDADDRGILFHHRRTLADGEILFLVNTSIEFPSAGTIESPLGGVEQWNVFTGKTERYPFEKKSGRVSARFELPPSGSLLLFLPKKALEPIARTAAFARAIPPSDALQILRSEPNVLTLDHVDITAGGETKTNIYFYDAGQFAWQKNGMDRNPWDSAVQFKDELISKTFPAGSGFEASYRFSIEGAVPKNLAIVIERPDLYTITCNGHPIAASLKPSRARASLFARTGAADVEFTQWWLDKSFGRIDIAAIARTGENVVTIHASPFTMFHELEPAYVLGDFTLKPVAKGFVIAPNTALKLGHQTTEIAHVNNPDGTMWLTGGIQFEGRDADDRAPFVIFDLRRAVDLSAIQIWNYNENHVRDLTTRGVSRLRISGALTNSSEAFVIPLGTFDLARATGGEALAETLRFAPRHVRFVRFDILANHNGITYPAAGTPPDNGFAGLAEVRFLAGDSAPVERVSVVQFSGELPSHSRRARFLVDGSGLGVPRFGWNRQGHPFYAAGVVYRQPFEFAEKPSGKFLVTLPDWHGSVAKVTVNGKHSGWISAPPWQCDVTAQLKRGANAVEVTVIGTLKNTLGPHHGNPQLGAAWPSQFRRSPEGGLPAGNNYHTVAYGLFAPFVLEQISAEPVRAVLNRN